MFDQKAVIEAVKELGRVALIAALPLCIDGLAQGQLNWRLVGVTAIIAILRAIDKWVHEYDGSIKSLKDSKGILPF